MNLSALGMSPPTPTVFSKSELIGEISGKTTKDPVGRKGDFDIKPVQPTLIGSKFPNVAPTDATRVARTGNPNIDKMGLANKQLDPKAKSYSKQDAKSALRNTAQMLLGNPAGVAGIMGNVDEESKFNSGAIGDTHMTTSSFGMFQHREQRLENLKAYAEKQGKSYSNPEVQTEFALQEAKSIKINKYNTNYYAQFNSDYSDLIDRYKGSSLYDALRDPYITKEEAATLWVGYFERPSKVAEQAKKRSASAAKYYAGGSLKKNKYDLGGMVSLATAGSQAVGNTMDLFNDPNNPNIGMSIASGVFKNPMLGPLGAVMGGVEAYRKKQQYGIQLDKLGLGNFNQGKEDYANSLANFSTARGFYAMGGETREPYFDYEVEDKEVVQGDAIDLEGGKGKKLASDMTVVTGETHEEGGVQGSGGERVFSDRIKPSPSLTKVVTKLGFKVGEQDTYATIATKLGKLKGDMEKKLEKGGNVTAVNTAKTMIPKLDMLIEATYQDQEATKGGEGNTARIFAMGGKLPKYPLGGGLTSYSNSLAKPMSMNGKLPFTTFNNQVSLGNPAKGIQGTGIASFSNSVANPVDYSVGQQPVSGNGVRVGSDMLATLTPSLLSGFGYLNSMLANARLRMPNAPNLLSLLPNTYVDRTQSARNNNEATARAMMSQLPANNIGDRQAMFSNLLKANNELQIAENQRRDNYNNNLTAQNAGIKQQNVGTLNAYNQDYTDAQNQKIANQQQATGAFLTNLTTGIRENNQRALDLTKMGLIADSRMIGRDGMKQTVAERTKRLKDLGLSDAQIVKILGE